MPDEQPNEHGMPEDSQKLGCLLDEEFRLTLEVSYRLAACSLVIDIEARELRLEADGDARSKAAAAACIAMARWR